MYGVNFYPLDIHQSISNYDVLSVIKFRICDKLFVQTQLLQH